MSKEKRPVGSYIESAKSLAKFAPSLKKYKRRKTLSPQEKGAITRKENALRFHTQHLIPVTKRTAKEFKEYLFIPPVHDKQTKTYVQGKTTKGITALEFRNTSPDAKPIRLGKDLVLMSNGRKWLYWRLDRDEVKSRRGMSKAAEKAFNKQFPIERVAELAQIAFDKLKPRAVYLWAPTGRVGDGFADLKQFSMWLQENWHEDRYSQQEKWVNGIAILMQ